MSPDKTYLFRSDRLGFRNWHFSDIDLMAAINADPIVMEFFPTIQSRTQTIEFIERMQNQLAEKGFCYFAVDKMEDGEFIGFIGLSEQIYEAPFTPCIDIGWRLNSKTWKRGYATEGAKRCLQYAFEHLNLEKINAIAPLINLRSEQVMKNIGMKKVMHFKHSKLANDERLKNVCYMK
jgi:RimJ/RimL family protein N-acetyltransferase